MRRMGIIIANRKHRKEICFTVRADGGVPPTFSFQIPKTGKNAHFTVGSTVEVTQLTHGGVMARLVHLAPDINAIERYLADENMFQSPDSLKASETEFLRVKAASGKQRRVLLKTLFLPRLQGSSSRRKTGTWTDKNGTLRSSPRNRAQKVNEDSNRILEDTERALQANLPTLHNKITLEMLRKFEAGDIARDAAPAIARTEHRCGR